MSFSWKHFLAGLKKLATPRQRARGKGRPSFGRAFVPMLERLEDRTMLSVTVGSPSGNAVSILGTAGDQLWLQTNSQSGQFQYSTDGTNYTNLGVNVASDATITLGMMQQVHLGPITGQGNAITLQALGVPNGVAGQLASPSLLTVENTLATAGGNLSILNMQGIEIDSGVTVSTRNIGPNSTDYLNAASTGNSGALKLTTENPDTFNPIVNINFNYPHITVDAGAEILAQADGKYQAGDITLTAANTNYALDGLTFASEGDTVRSAGVTFAGGAVVEGGQVTISATSGDVPPSGLLNGAGQNPNSALESWGTWVGGLLNHATTIRNALPLNLLSLPLSLNYRNASTSVTVGQNALIEGSGDVSIQSAATADAEGQALYSKNSQVGLAAAAMIGITDAETDIQQGAQVISGGNVTLGATADSTAMGAARILQNLPGTDPNPNHDQFALSFGYTQQTAHATLEQGATVQAAGNVDFESNGQYSNSQSSTSASYKDGRFGSDVAVSTSESDIQADVKGTLIAGGTTAVPALTVNPFTAVDFPDSSIQVPAGTQYAVGQPLAYNVGPGGAIGGLVSGQTYYVVPFNSTAIRLAATPADATAGTYLHFDQYPTLVGGANVTPITNITDEQDGVIDFGFNPGFTNGEPVTYHAVAGKAIGGLTDGTTYYVIVNASSPDTIQLSATAPSNGAAVSPIPLSLAPSFTTATSATPFRQSLAVTVNPQGGPANSIQFGFDAGFQLGDAFTYQGADINGLTPGTTYWVIPTSDPTVIQLAATSDDAANGNAITLGPDNAQETLTFDPALTLDSNTNTIDLGFNYGLAPSPLATGTALTYHQALGLAASGLKDGTTYYLIQDPADPRLMRLALDAGSAQTAYNDASAAYQAAKAKVYDDYLASNPGDTTGATAAANTAAQDLGETWADTSFASDRAGTAPPVGNFPVTVDPSANTLDFGFDPGFSRNEPVVYQGSVTGSPGITGLTPGTIYYVQIPNPVASPGVIQLTTQPVYLGLNDLTITPVSLSLPSGTTTTVSFGTLTSVDVSVANNTLTLDDPSDPFDPGYQNGDPFAYEGPVDPAAGDVGIVGLTPGTVYHVQTTATPGVFQLTDGSGNVVPISLPAGTTTTNINYTLPFTPEDSRPHLVVDFGTFDTSVLSGTAQTFTPPAAEAGITVKATLSAADRDKASGGLGKDPNLVTKPEARSFNNIGNAAKSALGDKSAKTIPGSTGNPTPTSIAGSVVIQVAQNNVQVDIAPTAVLEAATDVTVGAALTETTQTSVSASISKPKTDPNNTQQQTSVALGLSGSFLQQTVKATVEGGAQIDAGGKVRVTATTTYQFVEPVPTSDVVNTISKDPVPFVTALTTDAQFGLAGFAVNNQGGASVSDNASNSLGVGGNLQLNIVTNDTEALVGAALIDQKVNDPTYGLTFRNPNQSVAVDAETDCNMTPARKNRTWGSSPEPSVLRADDYGEPAHGIVCGRCYRGQRRMAQVGGRSPLSAVADGGGRVTGPLAAGADGDRGVGPPLSTVADGGDGTLGTGAAGPTPAACTGGGSAPGDTAGRSALASAAVPTGGAGSWATVSVSGSGGTGWVSSSSPAPGRPMT